jgi:DNA-binding winged helix-turn-helix (wHTH) protein
MQNGRNGEFEIGGWQVKPAEGLLCHQGTQVRIQPKAMDVLVYLASRPDEVVSKQALFENVWTGTFVSDVTLARVISDLRKALAEDGRGADALLKTIPKRGYVLSGVKQPKTRREYKRYAWKVAFALTLLMPILVHDLNDALLIWRMHAITLSIFTGMFLLTRSTMWAMERSGVATMLGSLRRE